MTPRRASLLCVLAACGPLVQPVTPGVPAGVACEKLFVVGQSVDAQLALAKAGDCVLLPQGDFEGNFTVPTDVSLLAGEGAAVTLRAKDAAQPILTVRGGGRTVLRGFKLVLSGGPGLVIEPGPVNMVGVSVSGASQALTIRCGEPACAEAPNVIEASELSGNASGLMVSGARLKIVGGAVTNSSGTRLSDGAGIVARAGAMLELEGTRLSGNALAGVIVDGAGTKARLTNVAVKDNAGRGVWLQGLTQPDSVVATGLTVTGNALVGIGAVGARGVSVTDSAIGDTKPVRVAVGVGVSEDVGDGIALLSGCGAVALQRLSLSNSARAQLLVDGVDGGVEAAGVNASGGRYRAVVQRSAAIGVDAGLVDAPPGLLPVVDSRLTLGL